MCSCLSNQGSEYQRHPRDVCLSGFACVVVSCVVELGVMPLPLYILGVK